MGDPFRAYNDPQEPRPLVEFFEEAVENATKSAAAGHPVYDSQEMVSIIFPGDQFTTHTKIVSEEHRQKYAHEYGLFKAGHEQTPEGTPLTEWPGINKAWAKTLQAMKVLTVEQLASVDDGRLQHLGMGARDIRDKARRYVETAAGAAPAEKLAADVQKLSSQANVDAETIAALKTENAVLRQRLAEAGSAAGAGAPEALPTLNHPLMQS